MTQPLMREKNFISDTCTFMLAKDDFVAKSETNNIKLCRHTGMACKFNEKHHLMYRVRQAEYCR